MPVSFHKFVSALPALANTVADGIYFVRVGLGFDMHVANSDASAIHKINIGGTITELDYWTGTQAEYDALSSYDDNTLYLIDSSS